MRITFERTGGFMGRKVNLTLELNDLPAEQAETLRRLIDAANFLDIEEMPLTASPARDVFNYMITVETKNVQHTVRATDTTLPDTLRPLIEELSQLARK